MRQVVSLSLPENKVRAMKDLAKKRGYESVSSYIQNLLEADKDLISETALLKTVTKSRREYAAGKSLKAASIADLL